MRWSVLVLCCGCGRIYFDATPDAAFPTGPFGPAVAMDVFNTPTAEDDVSLTADMLEIYFSTARTGTNRIYRSVRQRVDDPWPAPVDVIEIPSVNNPRIAADGLMLLGAASTLPGSVGGEDVWFATRSDRTAQFSALQLLPGINTVDDEFEPWLSRDGLVLYLTYLPAVGSNGVARAQRSTATDPFGPATVLAPLEGVDYDGGTWVREDELLLLFHSDRVPQNREIFVSTRASVADPWGAPAAAADLNSSTADSDVWMSPDGHTIYFVSRRGGNDDIYMATR